MKTSNDPRHISRQTVVQELFAWDAQLHLKSQENPEGKTPKTALDHKTIEIIDNLEKIDKIISECAPEWEPSKINQIDLAILRLATFELLFEATEPAKVVIDEAVEIAKEFGTETSPAFVNGALGKVFLMPQRIKKIIAVRLGTDDEKTTDDAELMADLNATKLEVSDLIAYLEKDYNFTLPSDIETNTVGDIVEAVIEQNE